MRLARALLSSSFVALAIAACGGGAQPSPPPPCDSICQDVTALRALRDAIKLAFNLGLQGKPVGPQDANAPCPLGGNAHVHGTATSNAQVGSTEVALTYDFTACVFSQTTGDANETYAMTIDGSVSESGTIAVQPSATTALELSSEAITLSGTVYAPPITYEAEGCALQLGQNGNALSGTLCGRQVGLTL